MRPLTGRDRVWTALKGGALSRPPKGEVFIADSWLRKVGFQNLGQAVEYLQSDLVVLPLAPSTDWRAWAKRHIFLFGYLQGPVTFLSERQGWHDFSRLLIKQPLEARTLMAALLAESVQGALAALDRGCEGIVIFDDLAGDKGLLINPRWLQEHYFPLMEQTLAQLDYKHTPVIFHSDGNILSLVPLLKATGFWGIQGLQPSVGISPADFREQRALPWVYWGNFEFEGPGRLKHTGEIGQDINELLTSWRDFPGFIFGSSGGLYKELPLPAVKAAYDAVEHWRGERIWQNNTK